MLRIHTALLLALLVAAFGAQLNGAQPPTPGFQGVPQGAGPSAQRDIDAEYPALLLALPTAPSTLHVRGSLVEGDALAVAVVGSRRATPT